MTSRLADTKVCVVMMVFYSGCHGKLVILRLLVK